MTGEPLLYRVAAIRASLVADVRFVDQAVELEVGDGRIVIRGEVATAERRSGIVALVREMADDLEVVDDLCVAEAPPGADPGPEIL